MTLEASHRCTMSTTSTPDLSSSPAHSGLRFDGSICSSHLLLTKEFLRLNILKYIENWSNSNNTSILKHQNTKITCGSTETRKDPRANPGTTSRLPSSPPELHPGKHAQPKFKLLWFVIRISLIKVIKSQYVWTCLSYLQYCKWNTMKLWQLWYSKWNPILRGHISQVHCVPVLCLADSATVLRYHGPVGALPVPNMILNGVIGTHQGPTSDQSIIDNSPVTH